VLRRNLRRGTFLEFFAQMAPTKVALEACAASHHWGRALRALGHEVAARPGMATAAVKSAEQQANAMVLSVRELLSRQRTQLVNALHGHTGEFGLVAVKSDKGVRDLLVAAQESSPGPAVEALALLGRQIEQVETELAQADASCRRNTGHCQQAACWRRSQAGGG